MDGIESRRVELVVDDDPVEVRYLTGGSGPPMVFLHGIGLDAATVSWRYALEEFTEEYRVYALDFPGHGESDRPDRTYTTEYYVSTLRAFRDSLGIEGGTLVGLSMGGAVALGYTLDGGDADRLVL
ncbi:MAG: alpha/beta fold hydrolase, partial [Haloarculaceae archaeon]